MSLITPFTRRTFLKTSGAATIGALAMPAISRAASRPQFTHGLQSGDISGDSAMIWARADRPSRMFVEWATTESFTNPTVLRGPDVVEKDDFAGKLDLTGLPAGQDIFYRVKFLDLGDFTTQSDALTGHLRTPPMNLRDISFVWSGDTAGQGWGIDIDRGGMKTYATMATYRPDFFIHSGDTVYADGPIEAEKEMPDGGIWRSVVLEEKTKVAETLDEFRANWKYNMMDDHVRAFNAEVPVYFQWDDHEVVNNWYPGEQLTADDRYTVKSASLLAARANHAFLDMTPIRPHPRERGRIYRKVSYGPMLDIFFLDMRSYRGRNDANNETVMSPDTAFLGAQQVRWLKEELLRSPALWKVIASDMPIGMIVYDDWKTKSTFENMANGDGPPRGRELEFAELLRFVKAADIENIVFLTADVHYTAAHYYDPDKAQFQDFKPFWEFVSGPIHAGTFGPNEMDNTFGPQVRFSKHPSEEQGVNLPPSYGLQFFGHVKINGRTGVMTVTLKDVNDQDLWSTDLAPEGMA